ncbi:MAG TPA: glycosyltransferase family 2 protein [Polyangiaceae bacterium]
MPRRVPAIVLHWNNPDGAMRTARSMREHAPFCDVTIVENGSSPEARAEIEQLTAAEGVRLVTLDRNLGFTGGMNFAVLRAGLCTLDDFVVLSCHGIEVTSGCVDRLVAAMEADERAGLVAPRISNDTPESFNAPADWEALPETSLVPISWAVGGLTLLRVSAFQSVGGYDERMFAYWEDADLTKRLRSAGWTFGMIPSAVILEDGSTLPRFGRIYLIARNQILSSQKDGPAAVLGQAWKTLVSSGQCMLASLVPWRSAERRAVSRLFARGHFYALTDALSGVTGPGRAIAVPPKQAS